jgi:hypothetical protein
MDLKRLAPLLAIVLASSAALATTYVRVEKDGSKTYSDRPIPGGQPIELESAQTYSAPPAPSAAQGEVPRDQQLVRQMESPFQYQNCSVTPQNDATFTNPEAVPVGLLLTPPLRLGDTVELSVDGARVPGGPTTTNFSMPQPFRGAHTVTAVVKDTYGRTLCTTSATFHVFRPSLNMPNRRR